MLTWDDEVKPSSPRQSLPPASHSPSGVPASPSLAQHAPTSLAAAPILAQAHVESRFTVEQRLFSRRPDYLLRVRGLSMRDAGILDGDLLAVHSTREAQHHQIVVARLGDEVTVKRLVRQRGHIELHPANPDFQPIVVGPEDAFEIEGVMVGLIRDGSSA